MNILLTCIGGKFSWDTINALRYNDNRIIGCDSFCVDEKVLVNTFYQIPPGKDSRHFNKEVLRICKHEKIDIVIPRCDEEVYSLSKITHILSSRDIKCPIPATRFLDIILDKGRLLELLIFKKLLDEEVLIIKNNFDPPAWLNGKTILKPATSRGSKGVLINGNVEEFKRNLRKIGNLKYICMPFYKNNPLDIDVIAKNGKLIYFSAKKRLWNDPFVNYNLSCKYIKDGERFFYKTISKAVALLKLNGAFDFECIYEDGRPIIYELNPRFSGSAVANTGFGFNIFRAFCDLFMKNKICRPRYDESVIMKYGTEKIKINDRTYEFSKMKFIK